jgi:hypothetical protein
MSETYPLELRNSEDAAREMESQLHLFGDGIICDTDTRGYAEPGDRSPAEIVVEASEGFIPLWAGGTTLRWRFQEHSMSVFVDPEAGKAVIKELLGEALLQWGDAAPVRFSEQNDSWDFEIAMREADRCTPRGCVLASAFFPDAGRHELVIYPKMFSQSRKEQVDTIIHEIGHTFGLRHFFANISETRWASEIFGVHKPFSIMNYGGQSELTPDDKNDLRRLYQLAWSGELTEVNRTPIRFVRPFHTAGAPPGGLSAVVPAVPAVPAVVTPRYERPASVAASTSEDQREDSLVAGPDETVGESSEWSHHRSGVVEAVEGPDASYEDRPTPRRAAGED